MRAKCAILFTIVASQAVLGVLAAELKNEKKNLKPSTVWTSIVNNQKNLAKKYGLKYNVTQSILNGVESAEVKYFATVEVAGTYYCGGVLIDTNYIVTSASCIDPGYAEGGIKVMLGLHTASQTEDVQSFTVGAAHMHKHPGYDPSTYANDIATVHLAEGATLTNFVKTADLNNGGEDEQYDGKQVKLLGWGSTSASEFSRPTGAYMTKNQIVKPISYCQGYTELSEMDPKLHICTVATGEASGACWGDEGGPVMYTDNWGTIVALAITSYQPFQCPQSVDYPSRHTKVNFYLPWLASYFHIDGFTALGDITMTGGEEDGINEGEPAEEGPEGDDGTAVGGVVPIGEEEEPGPPIEGTGTAIAGPEPTAGGADAACDLKRLYQEKLKKKKQIRKRKNAMKKMPKNLRKWKKTIKDRKRAQKMRFRKFFKKA